MNGEPQIKCPLCGKPFLLYPRKKDGTTRHGYTDVKDHVTNSLGPSSGCEHPRAPQLAAQLTEWKELCDNRDTQLEKEHQASLT